MKLSPATIYSDGGDHEVRSEHGLNVFRGSTMYRCRSARKGDVAKF